MKHLVLERAAMARAVKVRKRSRASHDYKRPTWQIWIGKSAIRLDNGLSYSAHMAWRSALEILDKPKG